MLEDCTASSQGGRTKESGGSEMGLRWVGGRQESRLLVTVCASSDCLHDFLTSDLSKGDWVAEDEGRVGGWEFKMNNFLLEVNGKKETNVGWEYACLS